MSLVALRRFLPILPLIASLAVLPKAASADAITQLGISYAYYDPVSLVLKDQGFLQKAVGPGVSINWVLSQGSNKALEFLRGNGIQFGQTAGSAALLGRANGAPVQAIGVTTNAEWTAIVVPAASVSPPRQAPTPRFFSSAPWPALA